MAQVNAARGKRNTTLEFFKLLSACLVVVGHIGLYGKINLPYNAAARFVIPFFYISSGFFCYKSSPEKVLKIVKKLLVVYLIAELVYNIYNITELINFGGVGAILPYYASICNLGTLKMYLLVNLSPTFEPLWFLLAMLYCHVMQYFVSRWRIGDRLVFAFSALGLLALMFLSEGMNALGRPLPPYYYRNFLIMGYPLMGLGMFVRKYRERFMKLHTGPLLGLIVLGLTEEVLSALYLGRGELYLGSYVVAVCLMVICLKYPELSFCRKFEAVSSFSLFVYLSHMLIYNIIKKLVALTPIDTSTPLYMTVAPLVVCVLATLGGYLVDKAKKYLKRPAGATAAH